MKKLKILSDQYFDEYQNMQKITIEKHFKILSKKSIAVEFPLNVAKSAVFSSQIEGNPIDLGTFLRYQQMNIKPKNKSFIEIQDLIKAYEFAQKTELTFHNILKVQKILSKEILKGTGYSGIIRDKPCSIYNSITGEVVYEAADITIVKSEMTKLFYDISTLLANKNLTISEVFYHASQIHLRLVQIHPFADGNGRTSRLLEKWFIAQFYGEVAWNIHSERFYYMNIKEYYKLIKLGKNYESLQQEHYVPFLCLLPKGLRYSYK